MIRLDALLWVHASYTKSLSQFFIVLVNYCTYTKSLTQFLLAHSLNFSCPKSLIQFSVFCTYTNRLLAYQISYRLSSSSLFGQEQGIKYPAGIIVFCLVVSNLYCIRSSFSSFIHSTPTNP